MQNEIEFDRPWLKYYDKEFLTQELPKMNIYDYMKFKTENFSDSTAITFYGKKITYDEFYENINQAVKMLLSMGVKKDDRILTLLPNIPETAYLLYASSMIGSVMDFIDPRPDSASLKTSAKKILDTYVSERTNHIICLDQCYVGMISLIENELKELGLDNILLISANNSMDIKTTINYLEETLYLDGFKKLKDKLKNIKALNEKLEYLKRNSCLKLLDYKTLSNDSTYMSTKNIGYVENQLTTILHTSGTTGLPKPIPLTNDNMNTYVHQTFGANMPMQPNDNVLHALPYFAAFGTVGVAHAGFCHANNLHQIPEFSVSSFGKMILKHKPQTIIGPPTWLLNLLNDKNLKNKDLSFIKMLTYGGAGLEPKYEMEINEFLKQHNCSVLITKGHGMSELCGCASYATGEYNLLGSIGIPLPNTIYALVNPDTKELIKMSENQNEIEGEVIISSPSATIGKLDEKVITPHCRYGNIDFINTQDIARMNKDGVFTFLMRSDRTFTRYDGYKYKPYEVENIIKTHKNIKECVITPYFDKEKLGNMPLATIILEDDLSYEEKVNLVKDIVEKDLMNNELISSRQIPSKIQFRDDLPLTHNEKINYKTFIKNELDGTEFTILMEETNISIGKIEILEPRQKTKTLQL